MRRDIEFNTEDGVTLRGWLYLPDDASEPVATVVMAHGFSALKENYLDRYAEVYAVSGLGALVFDNRNFGASDGEPRQEIDPWQQIRDYRDAITYASGLDEVDGGRIGVWGSSYSGAHVLVLGAIDGRVKCVASQVPLISGHSNARRLIRADVIATVKGMFEADRQSRFAGEPPGMIAVRQGIVPGRNRLCQLLSKFGRSKKPSREGLTHFAPEKDPALIFAPVCQTG